MNILEFCQWDFLSHDEAASLSPERRGYIFYRRQQEPGITERLTITQEPFGFYSWTPSCPDDFAQVLEYKTKPKLWTPFPVPESHQSNSHIIERLLEQRGFNVGVAYCGEKHSNPLFAAAIARTAPHLQACTVPFQLSEETLLECADRHSLRVHYLDSIVSQILEALSLSS